MCLSFELTCGHMKFKSYRKLVSSLFEWQSCVTRSEIHYELDVFLVIIIYEYSRAIHQLFNNGFWFPSKIIVAFNFSLCYSFSETTRVLKIQLDSLFIKFSPGIQCFSHFNILLQRISIKHWGFKISMSQFSWIDNFKLY